MSRTSARLAVVLGTLLTLWSTAAATLEHCVILGYKICM